MFEENEEIEENEDESNFTIIPNSKWIKRKKEYIDYIEKNKNIKNNDRLDLLTKMKNSHEILKESVVGWTKWLDYVEVMSIIPKEEFKVLSKEYMNICIKYVNFDIKVTELVEKYRIKDFEPLNREQSKHNNYTV